MSNDSTTESYTQNISLREKICYAFGDVGFNFTFDLGQIFLLKFYTDTLGLPPAAAGTVFLVTKVFDAFADITVGSWVDARKNIGPRGKFRPFMLYGALPLALVTMVTFINPDFTVTGKLVWAYFSYMLFGLVYSMVNIPYGAILPAMTQDPKQRANLAAWRQGGSTSGLLIVTVFFVPLISVMKTTPFGILGAVAVFAAAGAILQWISYANIRERIVVVKKNQTGGISIPAALRALTKNQPLMWLCLVNLLTFSAFNVKLAVQTYYCQYVLGDMSMLPYMGFFSMGCVLIGVFSVTPLVNRFGKNKTFIAGCIIWAIGDLVNYLFINNLHLFVLFSCVAFFGSALVNSLYWAFISDCVEFGEWKTGVRAEGVTYSFFTFFRKCATAIAGFVPGIVLAWVGYVPNVAQTESALGGIKGLMFIYPGALALATSVIWFLFYSLDEVRFGRILHELRTKKGTSATVAAES
jgi:GPH family glycoside/pentoside/hexuronide:cation symporter